MTKERLVLCSGSPRRQQLLQALGFDFETSVKDVDESFPESLKADHVALYLAQKKSDAFKTDFETGKIYITADTIVWLKNKVLGKPSNEDDAFSMLKNLSGNTHSVFTAVCFRNIKKKKIFFVKSDVSFKKISDEQIRFYIQHYKPYDKAGAYGAQECLPEGMNPCSSEEKEFLKSIHHEDLFEKTLSKHKNQIPIIEGIEGSYFNVMGLPIVELYRGLAEF